MKKIIFYIILFIGLSSCLNKEIDSSKLKFGDNLFSIDSIKAKYRDFTVDSTSEQFVLYKEKPFTGLATSYYGNNQVMFKIGFKKGLPDGLMEQYYPNGNMKTMANFSSGVATGELKTFFNDGNIKSSLFQDENGLKQGVAQSYYENSDKKTTITYKDGYLNGPYCYYYEGKIIAEKGNHKNNLYDGLIESYYEDGTLKSKTTYEEGILNGISEIHQEDGSYYIGNFKNNELDGEWVSYNKNGNVIKREYYKNGEFINSTSYENQNSSNTVTCHYCNKKFDKNRGYIHLIGDSYSKPYSTLVSNFSMFGLESMVNLYDNRGDFYCSKRCSNLDGWPVDY